MSHDGCCLDDQLRALLGGRQRVRTLCDLMENFGGIVSRKMGISKNGLQRWEAPEYLFCYRKGDVEAGQFPGGEDSYSSARTLLQGVGENALYFYIGNIMIPALCRSSQTG